MKQLIKAINNDAKAYCFDHPEQHRFIEMLAKQVGNQVQFDVELEEWDWKYDEFDEDDNCGHQSDACKGDDYYLKNFYISNQNLWAIKGHKFSNISTNLVATLTKLNSHSFVTYDCELNQLQFINLGPGYHIKNEDYISDDEDEDGMMLQAVFRFEQDFINYDDDQLADFAKLIKDLRKHILVKDIRSKMSDELIYNIEHLDNVQQEYYQKFNNDWFDERLLKTKIVFNVDKQGKITNINASDLILDKSEFEYYHFKNEHQWLDQLNQNSPLRQILMKHNPNLFKATKTKSL